MPTAASAAIASDSRMNFLRFWTTGVSMDKLLWSMVPSLGLLSVARA